MRSVFFMICLVICFGLAMPLSSCTAPVDTEPPPLTSSTGNVTVTRYLADPPAFAGMTSTGLYKLEPTLVELETDYPELPGEMAVYERIVFDITDDYARDLAARLGFTDEHPLTGGERAVYSFTQADRTLEIGLTGSLSLFSAQYVGSVPDLPSDDECIGIATAWLENNDLYPEHVTRVEVGYGGMSTAEVNAETGETGPTIYYSISVKFIAALHGYDCFSSVANILIGDGGEIIRAYVDLARYREYGLVRLITPLDAFEILEEYQARLTPVREEIHRCFSVGSGSRINIDSITLEYWGTSRSEYLLPVYVFRGTTDAVIENENEFAGYVDAVMR